MVMGGDMISVCLLIERMMPELTLLKYVALVQPSPSTPMNSAATLTLKWTLLYQYGATSMEIVVDTMKPSGGVKMEATVLDGLKTKRNPSLTLPIQKAEMPPLSVVRVCKPVHQRLIHLNVTL